jgi:hypothetical protein
MRNTFEKKWLAVGISITAVVLLVLGSLSNVVGYQSVKSTVVNDSPLFSTRTQRATNQQQNILTSQYLGMGKGNPLQFPMRDNQTESLKRVIEYISKMDDKTFAFFTELVIQRSKQDGTLRNLNQNVIIQILSQLRTKSITLLNSPFYKNNYKSDMPTLLNWFPGCWLYYWLWAFLAIPFTLLNIFLIIMELLGWAPYKGVN